MSATLKHPARHMLDDADATRVTSATRNIDVPQPGEGEMLCRTVWMSVDPYMRGRMRPEVIRCVLLW